MTKTTIGGQITAARQAVGWSRERLAHEMHTSPAQISRYEKNERDPRTQTLVKMSDLMGVTLSFLLGSTDDPFTDPVRGPIYYKPVLGRIAAGTPREAIEQGEETHWVSESVYKDHPRGVWLQVSGNSMNKLFPDGCLVYVDLDAEVHDSDVAVVFVNGDDATVKRIYWEGDAIRLCPESYDPDYRDRVIFANDPDAPEVRVLGKVVSYTAPDRWRA